MEDKLVELYDLTWRGRVARVLEAASRLRVFTNLSDESLALEEICRRCNTKPEATAKLLEICAVMGWVEMEGGIYRNSEFSMRYLVDGSDLYQGDIIAHGVAVSDVWSELENVVSQEELPVEDEAAGHRHFIMAMRNIAKGGRGDLFIKNVDLAGRKRMLDVGGGPASYSIAACKKYPELSVRVFDLAETIAIAKEQVSEANLTDRIELRAGDWDVDEFGEGFDVVMFSNVLHGAASGAESKLAKAHGAMEAGAMLVIQEFVLNDETAGPLVPAVFNMMVGVFRKGQLFSVIESAGFSDVRIVAADERIGSTWITAVKNKDAAVLCDTLVAEMKSVFGDDQKRIDHAMKVLEYADQIHSEEGGEVLVVKAAAILHDIGIQRAEQVHGSSGGKYQEIEGPPIAKDILDRLNVAPEAMEHICKIIANHHSAKDIDTLEFRIIWDADWLVNIPDVFADQSKEKLSKNIERLFKTKAGKKIAMQLFIS